MEKQTIKLPTIQDLFKSGFHFGHMTSKWNPNMSQYIYTTKDKIHIIDLVKTHELMGPFFDALSECAKKGNILIVGTKKQASQVVKASALKSGMYYVVNRWPGGLLTNFEIVKKGIDQMMKEEEIIAESPAIYTKKEIIEMKKSLNRKLYLYEGVENMKSMPSAVVIIDGNVERSAIREARSLGITLFGMVDTNTDPNKFDYFIPANDDATKSILLFLEYVENVIQETNWAKELLSINKLREDKLEQLKKKGEEARKLLEQERIMQAEKMRAIKSGKSIVVTEHFEEDKDYVEVEKLSDNDKKPKKTVKKAVKTNTKKSKSVGTIELKVNTIDKLKLTEREMKLLQNANIKTAEEISKMGKQGLIEVEGIGDKTADKILLKVNKLIKK